MKAIESTYIGGARGCMEAITWDESLEALAVELSQGITGSVHGESGSADTLIPAESDVDEDFSALWAQLEIDPGKGSCARNISIEVSAPSDGRIVSGSPAKSSRVKRREPALTKLVVDGDGSAPLPGEIEQDIIRAPGRTRVRVSPEEYRFSWTGSSRRKVMVAVGIEMAHTNVPPELISFQAISEAFTIGPCRK